MYDNGSMVRMEKRAVNKVGLIIIIIVAIAALGGGIFFIVKNHNNLDFSFPWSKKETKEEAQKKKEKEKVALERQKVKIAGDKSVTMESVEITPTAIKYDDTEGYVITVRFKNVRNWDVNIDLYNITIDEYQIDYNESFKINGNATVVREVKVSPEQLDLYNIETFKKLYIYILPTLNGNKKEILNFKKIVVENQELGDNTQRPQAVSNVGNADKLKIDFYKKEEDNDFTYVYFLLTNSSRNNNGFYSLVINAYKVNGDILTNNDFKEDVYDGNKKVVILRIPKSKYKKVDTLTISFFALRDDDVYTTKATTLEFNK